MVAKKAQGTVFVKWVRSGIGFPRRQKRMVRSLGLKRVNQVVRCPDTPQVRGLVARIQHLVEIVEEEAAAAWAQTPEYRIGAPAPSRSLAEPAEAELTPEPVAAVSDESAEAPRVETEHPPTKRRKRAKVEAEEEEGQAPAKKVTKRRRAEKK